MAPVIRRSASSISLLWARHQQQQHQLLATAAATADAATTAAAARCLCGPAASFSTASTITSPSPSTSSSINSISSSSHRLASYLGGSMRAFASAAVAAASAAADATTPGGGASQQQAAAAKLAELEALPFAELAEALRAATRTNPTTEAKLLVLISKAQTPAEVEEAVDLVRCNRARATRLGHYAPYTRAAPGALLAAAARAGAPPALYASLLERAHLLGLPMSQRFAEECLARAAGGAGGGGGGGGGGGDANDNDDGGAFDAAWAYARAHVHPTTKHMVFCAMHTYAARGRARDALAAAAEFEAGGGALPPSLAKLRAELKAAAVEASKSGGGGGDGDGDAAAAPEGADKSKPTA